MNFGNATQRLVDGDRAVTHIARSLMRSVKVLRRGDGAGGSPSGGS
jgi:hypothetical protein